MGQYVFCQRIPQYQNRILATWLRDSDLRIPHPKDYEVRKLYLFIEGGHPTLTSVKRETLWIELVNSLHPSEADDLWHMKDKKLQEKYDKITHLVAYNSFPEYLRQPEPEPTRDSQGRFTSTKKTKKKKAKK